MIRSKVCPRCGASYSGYPAISRLDNKTEICPDCGETEAMEQYLFGNVPDWLGTKEDADVQS